MTLPDIGKVLAGLRPEARQQRRQRRQRERDQRNLAAKVGAKNVATYTIIAPDEGRGGDRHDTPRPSNPFVTGRR